MRNKNKAIKSKLLVMTLAASMMFGSFAAFGEDISKKDVKLTTTPSTENVTPGAESFSVNNILYQTYDESDDAKQHLTSVTIGDAVYNVANVSEPKRVRKDTIAPDHINYTSEVWNGDGEAQKPADTMKGNGVSYHLENLYKEESKSQERTEVKNATVKYTGVEDSVSIPKKKAITFTDTDTKQEVTAMLPLKSNEVTNTYWDDNFQFDITISGYNANTYMLGEMEIPASADLLSYKDQFIKILALNPEKYEITSIDWNGNSYEEDGLVKRKAVGKGRKLVQDIEAVYEGEVTLPESIGYVWTAEYTEDIPDGKDVVYTMAVDAEYKLATAATDKTSLFDKIMGAVIGFISAAYTALAASFKEHPVFTSIPFVLVAVLIAFLITRKVRHRCIYNGKVKCPYDKRTKETCKSCPHFYKRGAAPKNNMTFKTEKDEK